MADYTMMYETYGGSPIPPSEVKHAGIPYRITDTIPFKKYYTFSGWTDVYQGSEVKYLPGSIYEKDIDTVFYAVYSMDLPTPPRITSTILSNGKISIN